MAGSKLYNPVDAKGQSRFQISEDGRLMYPISAVGTMSDGFNPLESEAGSYFYYLNRTGDTNPVPSVVQVSGAKNLLSNGSALFSFGSSGVIADVGTNPTVIGNLTARLGAASTSGGVLISNEPSRVVSNIVASELAIYTLMMSGEAVVRETDSSLNIYGAANELFLGGSGGTVSTTNGGTGVVGAGTTFTAASLVNAGSPYNAFYNGNTPSMAGLRAGDIIRITDGANSYFHRIASITDDTHLTIYPQWNGTTSGGHTYTLLRTGYGWPGSNIISIFNPASGKFYNYYVGNSLDRQNSIVNQNSGPGTIECYQTFSVTPTTAAHFMAPQTNNGAGANVDNVKATDIAYYKGFLLYGYGGSISWSVAGFPTNFTTGFGPNDFPATNITVVNNTDTFIHFAQLGEQLLALFQQSIWQVQATGTVPEFAFYRLPEATGIKVIELQSPQVPSLSLMGRHAVSARGVIFYNSECGLARLASGKAENVSLPVWATYKSITPQGSVIYTGWEESTDTVFVSRQDGSAAGLMYNVPTDSWSYFLPTENGSNTARAFTADAHPIADQMGSAYYSTQSLKIMWYDTNSSAPFGFQTSDTYSTGTSSAWSWASRIISIGDDYMNFMPEGFQFEGSFVGCTFQIYGGKTPYSMSVIASGTVSTLNNRELFGPKIDYPFLGVVLTSGTASRGVLVGANVYFEPRGR